MINLYALLMIGAGAAVAAQIGINAHLSAVAGSALWAANISFGVTMLSGVAALSIAVALGQAPLATSAVLGAPRWIWLGGLGGAVYVLFAILLAHRLGATLLSASGILGQLGGALLIDHYGWFGMPVQRLSVERVAGLVLIVIGVALVRWR